MQFQHCLLILGAYYAEEKSPSDIDAVVTQIGRVSSKFKAVLGTCESELGLGLESGFNYGRFKCTRISIQGCQILLRGNHTVHYEH